MFECFIIQTFHSFHKSTCGSRKRCQNNGDLFIKFKVTNNIDVDFLFLKYFKKVVIKTFGTFSNNTCMVTTYVRLGIGRNTITRKIQELGLDAADEG